jgi:hypothetical protein
MLNKSDNEVLEQLRELLHRANNFETVFAVMISGQDVTIVNRGKSENSQENLITVFLLLASILRDTAKGSFKEALDMVLLQDSLVPRVNQTRH